MKGFERRSMYGLLTTLFVLIISFSIVGELVLATSTSPLTSRVTSAMASLTLDGTANPMIGRERR